MNPIEQAQLCRNNCDLFVSLGGAKITTVDQLIEADDYRQKLNEYWVSFLQK